MEIALIDSFLEWNHTEYGGIETINVKNEKIWSPDLALTDVYDNPTDLGKSNGEIVVDYNGGCKMWPYKMSRGMGFPTMWYVRPAMSQISLRIRAV